MEGYVRAQHCEDLGCCFESFSMTPKNAGKFLRSYEEGKLEQAFEKTKDTTIIEFPDLRRIITDFFKKNLHEGLV